MVTIAGVGRKMFNLLPLRGINIPEEGNGTKWHNIILSKQRLNPKDSGVERDKVSGIVYYKDLETCWQLIAFVLIIHIIY